MENGNLSFPDEGTPGHRRAALVDGVISPLLANIYLHYVLDEWIEQEVKPRLRGDVFLIRYADDFVLGFRCEADARRVLELLPSRFSEYGLAIHPDKTRLVRFRPRVRTRGTKPTDLPHTFDFLGFTHYWGRSRKGRWVVRRKTASNRLTRAITKITEWCRCNRHRPLIEQQAKLRQKLQGHYNYYGITGNSASLSKLYHFATRAWKKWLSRRNRERRWNWDCHRRMMERYPLPVPVAVHSVLRHVAKP